ncbi:MAG: alpha-L-fucosidase [Bacteroidota bacterium]|nr:alpha-L-fucosidase [Bacteroidota bacterium]
MKKSLAILSFLLLPAVFHLQAQENNLHHQSSSYQWPTDPQVGAKLDTWQDQKFGILIHWGLYAVPGIIESWELCSEPWIERDSTIAYEDYKKWYWGLKKDFNPVKFAPDQWAQAAKDAGMRYVVFTTKHHDGFCMFDTKQTDFKITNGPFASNPKADVAKYVFDAFRRQGFMVGAYFSKPDWHSQDFWWSKYATPDRNVNYDIRKYPWKWNRFKQFTFNQISELMHNYGSIDILWLDGGWVRPLETVTDEVRSWGAAIPAWNQEVDIPRIAAMARQVQPGLLVVDRTVAGPYENYQTPEQSVPAQALDHPWESCITLGNTWGFVPNDQYKSPAKVIHKLIEIVAKGGSLLLGVGPRPDGTVEQSEVAILKEIGSWMRVNGAAIYGTRISSICRDGETFFTQSKDGQTRYALVRLPEQTAIPKEIEWKGNLPKKGSTMKLLSTGTSIKWRIEGDKVKVSLPASFIKKGTCPALAFSFQ